VEKQTEKKVKRLRTDNGLEFCNNEFNEFCANEGIARHRTDEQDITGESSMHALKCRFAKTVLGRDS